MNSRPDRSSNTRGHLPTYVKVIILAQASIILSFTVAMYQEYLNNTYLQDYTLSLFKSSLIADTLLSLVTVSVFAIGTFTLLGSMSTTKRLDKELKTFEHATDELDMPTMPILESINPASTANSSVRPRRRRPKVDTEDIYQSMIQYFDKNAK